MPQEVGIAKGMPRFGLLSCIGSPSKLHGSARSRPSCPVTCFRLAYWTVFGCSAEIVLDDKCLTTPDVSQGLGRSGRLEILVWCCAKRSIYREARQRRDDDHRCQASQLESLLRRLEVSCSSANRLASSEPSVDRSPFKPELLSELLRFLLLGSQLAQVRLPHAQPGNHCPHTPRRCAAACTGALAAARQPHTLCNLARLSRGLKSRDHGCLRISSLPDAAVT